MIDEWYRCLDFYYKNTEEVKFRNDNRKVIIKEIIIKWIKFSDEFLVSLMPNEELVDNFMSIAVTHFPKNRYLDFPNPFIKINLFDMTDLEKLNDLFNAINTKQKQIPATLITEIKQILFYIIKMKWSRYFNIDKVLAHYEYEDVIRKCDLTQKLRMELEIIFSLFKEYKKINQALEEKHSIPVRPEPEGEYQFFLEYDLNDELINPKSREEMERKQVKTVAKLYAGGVNPNTLIKTRLDTTNLPLLVAGRARAAELFRTMLAYGADPDKKIDNESPLELLLRMKKYKKDMPVAIKMLEAINWVRNKPQKSLDHSLKVKETRIYVEDYAIRTKLMYADFTIQTIFQAADFILPTCKSGVYPHLPQFYKLFSHYFHVPYESFMSQFGNNKFLDLIYVDEELIGFNSFEIHIPKNEDPIIVYAIFAALKEAYRAYQLSEYFIFRFPFCLAQLFPSKEVIVFYVALTFGGMNLAKHFDPYPKYTCEITDDFMEEKIKIHFLPEDEIHKDGIGRYIIERDSIIDPYRFDSANPNEQLFLRNLLCLENDSKEMKLSPPENKEPEVRSSLVAFPISKKRFDKFASALRSVDINLKDHTSQFSHCLSGLFKKLEEKKRNELGDPPSLRSRL